MSHRPGVSKSVMGVSEVLAPGVERAISSTARCTDDPLQQTGLPSILYFAPASFGLTGQSARPRRAVCSPTPDSRRDARHRTASPDHRPRRVQQAEDGWVQATYSYLAIPLFSEETGRYRLADGQQRSFAATDEVTDAFDELRTRMATLSKNGHDWHTATLTITADGKFAFDFNYDDLPQLEVVPICRQMGR
ncbi:MULTISPECIES: immunity protein YezG family protein [Myxococcus]|nr:immunity protein YezG family protein [Myxococcus xanthus]